MKPIFAWAATAALAALLGGAALPATAGGIIRPVDPQRDAERVEVTAIGTVANMTSNVDFTLEVRRQTFRVNLITRIRPPEFRRGDRLRVVGTLVDRDQINATQIEVLGRDNDPGRPGRPSNVISGTVRRFDRANGFMDLNGVNERVRINDDTEFYRNGRLVNDREVRTGDAVRVVGTRAANVIIARRVLFGGTPGWANGTIGEIVAISSREQTAEVDFDGRVETVNLRSATLRRQGRPIDVDDLRLGQDVRVTGNRQGGNINASLLEVVRQGTEDRPDNNGPFIEGRILNVAAGLKNFRISLPNGREQRISTDDDTRFTRDDRTIRFADLREGQRVRVRGDREGEIFRARRVEVIP